MTPDWITVGLAAWIGAILGFAVCALLQINRGEDDRG